MKERLQKILSARGVASRRRAEEMIDNGLVTVGGIPARLGDCADPEVDEILVDGKPLPKAEAYVYILLNKPRGYVTTLSDEKGRPNAAQLVADCGVRVYPVGRLDMDSEGLLLLTNDGDFAQKLTHPSKEVDKVYEVSVTGYTPGAQERLARPITLDGYTIAKPGVRLLNVQGDRARLEVTIHEGRNRQVRRMCADAGMEVKRLLRVREGKLSLGSLKSGQWRYLTEEEVCSVLKE